MSAGRNDGIRLGRGAVLAGALGLLLSGIVGALVVDHVFHDHAGAGETGHEHEEGEHEEGKHEEGEHEEGKPEEGEHEEGHVRLSPEARQNAKLEVKKAGPAKISVTLSLPGGLTLNADAVAHGTPRVAGTVTQVAC